MSCKFCANLNDLVLVRSRIKYSNSVKSKYPWTRRSNGTARQHLSLIKLCRFDGETNNSITWFKHSWHKTLVYLINDCRTWPWSKQSPWRCEAGGGAHILTQSCHLWQQSLMRKILSANSCVTVTEHRCRYISKYNVIFYFFLLQSLNSHWAGEGEKSQTSSGITISLECVLFKNNTVRQSSISQLDPIFCFTWKLDDTLNC